MEELSEIPLSNMEVLKVLKARNLDNHHPRTIEMIDYLESVKKTNYQMEMLRNIKGLEANLTTLVMLSNTSDTSLVSENDLKIINQTLKQHKDGKDRKDGG